MFPLSDFKIQNCFLQGIMADVFLHYLQLNPIWKHVLGVQHQWTL